MAVQSSDLIIFGSQNMPTNDTSASGGAVDEDARPLDQQTTEETQLEFVSDDGGDTSQTITVVGIRADGVEASEQLSLNGTTAVQTSESYRAGRVSKVSLDAVTTGNITVSQVSNGATLHVFTAGELVAFSNLQEAVSETSSKTFFEKVFYKNTNATDTLNNAEILLQNSAAQVSIALEGAKDGNDQVANRLTDPGHAFQGSGTPISIPGGNLGSGEAIGVWLRFQLAASENPASITWELVAQGDSA